MVVLRAGDERGPSRIYPIAASASALDQQLKNSQTKQPLSRRQGTQVSPAADALDSVRAVGVTRVSRPRCGRASQEPDRVSLFLFLFLFLSSGALPRPPFREPDPTTQNPGSTLGHRETGGIGRGGQDGGRPVFGAYPGLPFRLQPHQDRFSAFFSTLPRLLFGSGQDQGRGGSLVLWFVGVVAVSRRHRLVVSSLHYLGSIVLFLLSFSFPSSSSLCRA